MTYSTYLRLDEVLGAQRPQSDEPDELLFIVIHQVYELWFKELLHELDRLQQHFAHRDVHRSLDTLRRVLSILKVAVAQVDVLETMTPRQFGSFRARLDAASGFQSAQFRQLEALLGRRDEAMLHAYPPASSEHAAIRARLTAPSIYDGFCRLLADLGHPVPASVRDRDVAATYSGDQDMQDLLVTIYEQDGPEAQLSERLVDLDEGLQEWRYRHVKMVERTIGDKSGTGGSSGTSYLRGTLFTALFPDLWAIRRRL